MHFWIVECISLPSPHYSMCYTLTRAGHETTSWNTLMWCPTGKIKSKQFKFTRIFVYCIEIGGWANYCAPVSAGDLGMTVHQRGVRTSRFNKLTCSLWRLHLIAWEEKMKDVRQMWLIFKPAIRLPANAITDIIKGEIRFLFKSRLTDGKTVLIKNIIQYEMQNNRHKRDHPLKIYTYMKFPFNCFIKHTICVGRTCLNSHKEKRIKINKIFFSEGLIPLRSRMRV